MARPSIEHKTKLKSVLPAWEKAMYQYWFFLRLFIDLFSFSQ
jgi:hypothetical protein